MSVLSAVGDGLGTLVVLVAVPVAILAVGLPIAFVVSLLLGWLGLT